MTPEQRARLLDLVPKMTTMARRAVNPTEHDRRWGTIAEIEDQLSDDVWGQWDEAFMTQAEADAIGHDKPGTIRMTMAQVLSGMPPEHKED